MRWKERLEEMSTSHQTLRKWTGHSFLLTATSLNSNMIVEALVSSRHWQLGCDSVVKFISCHRHTIFYIIQARFVPLASGDWQNEIRRRKIWIKTNCRLPLDVFSSYCDLTLLNSCLKVTWNNLTGICFCGLLCFHMKPVQVRTSCQEWLNFKVQK